MRLLPFAALIASCAIALAADTPAVEFNGQRYAVGFETRRRCRTGSRARGSRSFTLPGESVDDWSKLFAFHSYPEMPPDPVTAAETVGKVRE